MATAIHRLTLRPCVSCWTCPRRGLVRQRTVTGARRPGATRTPWFGYRRGVADLVAQSLLPLGKSGCDGRFPGRSRLLRVSRRVRRFFHAKPPRNAGLPHPYGHVSKRHPAHTPPAVPPYGTCSRWRPLRLGGMSPGQHRPGDPLVPAARWHGGKPRSRVLRRFAGPITAEGAVFGGKGNRGVGLANVKNASYSRYYASTLDGYAAYLDDHRAWREGKAQTASDVDLPEPADAIPAVTASRVHADNPTRPGPVDWRRSRPRCGD